MAVARRASLDRAQGMEASVIGDCPTADQVALVIVAACRETGASPMDVLSGEFDHNRCNSAAENVYPISRARVYAAASICELFGCGRAASSRMCGASKKSEAAHLALIYSGSARWFSLETLRRVASAIDPERASRITLDREYPRAPAAHLVAPEGPCEFERGDRVEHPSYGPGTVAGVGPLNYNRRDYPLLIKFDRSRNTQTMYARVVRAAAEQVAQTALVPVPARVVEKAVRVAQTALVPAPRRAENDEFRGPLTLRKTAVAAHLCEDQTSELMGDPPPGRRAFSQNVAETYARIERETRDDARGER